MDIKQAEDIARECGFEFVGPLDVGTLIFREDIREMCNSQQCQNGYNKSWSCPPALAPLDELRAKASEFSEGVLVQTVGQMEDAFDFETVMEAAEIHAKHFNKFAKKMREAAEGQVLPLGAGTCQICETCTYPDEPCRYPDMRISSMESSGLLVGEVCKKNDMKYNHGNNTIAYTACCLF